VHVNNLVEKFNEYGNWRDNVRIALERYREGVQSFDLTDAASEQRLQQAIARLADDKLSIAFVAEFSRGKSELINSIFFAGYGQRIVPTSAGRTTMCPTELLYDETFPPSIRLLPIETRAEAQSTSDFKGQNNQWTVLPLDTASADGMLEAFKQVSLTKRVPVEEAVRYGLYDAEDDELGMTVDIDGTVEISQWRHAIVNFPHPLLKQGLVIVDTPGLNAIGTEPELTLNLIPNAHAVLFILAADAGVTKSDIDIWRNHIGNSGSGRMVVLNKIDSMWDELSTREDVDRQIAAQVSSVAQTLSLSEQQIFPVSAQKGLVGKINHDQELLTRSRLPLLEAALSTELIPARQDIIRNQLQSEVNALTSSRLALLSSRSRNVVEQLVELKSLRGKNRTILEHMMTRIDLEKREFDGSLFKLQATRSVFARLSADVFSNLGMSVLKQNVIATRESMERSRFSAGLRQAVREFFQKTLHSIEKSSQKTDEIGEMMSVMYRKFSTEHALALSAPMPFSLDKYVKEIVMIEQIYQKQFNATTIMTTPQVVLMQKFFDSIASRVRQCMLQANRDVETWLKVVMAPLEAQIGEHKAQLKRRRKSLEKIHEATDSLEEKVQAFEQMQLELDTQRAALMRLENELHAAILAPLAGYKAAA